MKKYYIIHPQSITCLSMHLSNAFLIYHVMNYYWTLFYCLLVVPVPEADFKWFAQIYYTFGTSYLDTTTIVT